jgi:hypothetical protein
MRAVEKELNLYQLMLYRVKGDTDQVLCFDLLLDGTPVFFYGAEAQPELVRHFLCGVLLADHLYDGQFCTVKFYRLHGETKVRYRPYTEKQFGRKSASGAAKLQNGGAKAAIFRIFSPYSYNRVREQGSAALPAPAY